MCMPMCTEAETEKVTVVLPQATGLHSSTSTGVEEAKEGSWRIGGRMHRCMDGTGRLIIYSMSSFGESSLRPVLA